MKDAETVAEPATLPAGGTLMQGRRGIVMGVANDRSIAWAIAQAVAAQGAEVAFTYQGEALEKRVVCDMFEGMGYERPASSQDIHEILVDELGEEGARFGRSLTGSAASAGALDAHGVDVRLGGHTSPWSGVRRGRRLGGRNAGRSRRRRRKSMLASSTRS